MNHIITTNSSHNTKLLLSFHNTRVIPVLSLYTLSIRHMLSGNTIYTARAAYYCLSTFTNQNVIDNATKTNHLPLTESIVDLSLDHDKGVVQHKTTILKHITNHKFNTNNFYDHYKSAYHYPRFKWEFNWEPNTQTDVRVLNELAVIYEYSYKHNSDIDSILATMDSRPGTFPHQVQINQDFWVRLKSGMDMLRHSTRGSIGLLTYDSTTGDNIQVTTDPITPQDLIIYNRKRIRDIENALSHDSIYNDCFKSVLNDYNSRAKKLENIDCKNPQDIFDIHNSIQQDLWTHIQRHPQYNRSISFIFTKHMDYSSIEDPQFNAFKNRFISLLDNKMYDLNRTQDRKDIFKAMLIAYKAEVDPKIVDKLMHLHYNTGITLNTHFLQDIAYLLKHGIL